MTPSTRALVTPGPYVKERDTSFKQLGWFVIGRDSANCNRIMARFYRECDADLAISLFSTVAALNPSDPLAAAQHLEELVRAAREVWNSVPSTYDEKDSMVQRHARALNELYAILSRVTGKP